MATLTIEAVPADAATGRPPGIKITSDLNSPEALMLLERVRALLAGQHVPALDGAHPDGSNGIITSAPPELSQSLRVKRG